jgi:hypothetical protein
MPEPDPKSTRPPQSAVFRESYLTLFEHPEHEAALRLLGELFHDLTCEGRSMLLETKDGGDVWRCDIRGCIGDFRQAADRLAEVARDLDEAGSGGAEVMRAVLVIADATAEVAPIAARLDAALTAYLASGEQQA